MLVALFAVLLSRLASLAVAGGFLVMAGLTTAAIYMSSLVRGCGGGTAQLDADGNSVSCLGEVSPFFLAAASTGVAIALLGIGLVAVAVIRQSRLTTSAGSVR